MLISPLIDHDWISYNVTLIMLYPVPLNESWPDCCILYYWMNPGLIALTKALLFSCHQKILFFDFVTTPTRVGGRSKVYKDKEQLPIGVHITT